MQKESSTEIQNALKEMNYPVTKTQLIEKAKSLNVRSEVIQAIEKIPDKEYKSASDVLQEFKGIKNLAHLFGM
jgi:hypothetical protein